jgi:hypothetical protein
MSAAAKNIPRIQMTPALEAAIAALPPSEVNRADPEAVRALLADVARSFEDPTFFYADESADELKAVGTLILVATLYMEHIKAGNCDRKT